MAKTATVACKLQKLGKALFTIIFRKTLPYNILKMAREHGKGSEWGNPINSWDWIQNSDFQKTKQNNSDFQTFCFAPW